MFPSTRFFKIHPSLPQNVTIIIIVLIVKITFVSNLSLQHLKGKRLFIYLPRRLNVLRTLFIANELNQLFKPYTNAQYHRSSIMTIIRPTKQTCPNKDLSFASSLTSCLTTFRLTKTRFTSSIKRRKVNLMIESIFYQSWQLCMWLGLYDWTLIWLPKPIRLKPHFVS